MEDGEILHNCKNFRLNRVKMAKNCPKMVEIYLGVPHMINDIIFNIFCFSTFSFAYFLGPVFSVIFWEFCLNSGFIKYQKKEVEKQKMIKMLSFIICGTPKLISAIFRQFLAIFTLFHLKFLQLCKIFPSSISGPPKYWSAW